MPKLRHHKKRNLGLVYEFLSRVVADAAVTGDAARAANALGIVSTHLSEGTELHQELTLHREAMRTRGASERLARRIVDELKAAGIRSVSRRGLIGDAKTRLIHDMNRGLGQGVFDQYRIPNYTAHASVGILLGRGLDGRLDEGVQLARVEDHLTEFLMSVPDGRPVYDRDASLYAYRTAVGLFEGEFGQELSPPQAEILHEYVRVSLGGNPAPFERAFERQRASVRAVLRARRSDEVFSKDPEMSARLDEAIADIDSLRPLAEDEAVERLMMFHNLQREIES